MHASHLLLAMTIFWGDVAVAAEGTEACANLRLLELEARQGRLEKSTIDCLGLKWDGSSRLGRGDISQVLILDADVKGDTAEYERLVEQHVRQIDARDPEIAWKWVNVLAQHPERIEALLIATDTAEQVGDEWSEEIREFRMARVHELRAEGALRQWQALGTDEAAKKRARKLAKDWTLYLLDHSNAGSPSRAVDICLEAGGELDWCIGGAAYRN